MNGKDVLDGFDLDDHRSFDKKIDAVSEIYRNPVVLDGKDCFHLELNAEVSQFVTHADPVRFFQQSWSKLRVDAVRGTENVVGDSLVNQVVSVSSVRRLRVLRGSAFSTQRMDRV